MGLGAGHRPPGLRVQPAAAGVAGAAGLSGIGTIGIGIGDHQGQALRIGGPFVAVQAAFDVGKLQGFAAASAVGARLDCLSLRRGATK